jgi:hypothetical protein
MILSFLENIHEKNFKILPYARKQNIFLYFLELRRKQIMYFYIRSVFYTLILQSEIRKNCWKNMQGTHN